MDHSISLRPLLVRVLMFLVLMGAIPIHAETLQDMAAAAQSRPADTVETKQPQPSPYLRGVEIYLATLRDRLNMSHALHNVRAQLRFSEIQEAQPAKPGGGRSGDFLQLELLTRLSSATVALAAADIRVREAEAAYESFSGKRPGVLVLPPAPELPVSLDELARQAGIPQSSPRYRQLSLLWHRVAGQETALVQLEVHALITQVIADRYLAQAKKGERGLLEAADAQVRAFDAKTELENARSRLLLDRYRLSSSVSES